MKIELLPCAPCDLEFVEKWINEKREAGWSLKRFGRLLPFLAFFTSGEGGEDYTISLKRPEEGGPKRVCILPDVGYIVKGKPKGAFGRSELLAASTRTGRSFIMMCGLWGVIIVYDSLTSATGIVFAAGNIACALALVAIGAYFMLLYDPAKSPRRLSLVIYILGTAFTLLWLLLLIIELTTMIP